MAGIGTKILDVVRKNIGRIFVIHLVYVALGTLLFMPLVGVIGRFLLGLSGQTALSDFDIAYFIMTPLGMASLILLAALLIAILVFEQASLMVISAGSVQERHVSVMSALQFTVGHARSIFFFAIRLVVRVLCIVLPFLALAGVVFVTLLSKYDINYYLAETPPVFFVAAAAIAVLLLAMFTLLLVKLFSWSLALPLVLFTDVSPAGSFQESRQQTLGHKIFFVKALAVWGVASLLMSMVVMGFVQFLGGQVAPLFFNSMTLLVVVLGGLLVLWALCNLLVTTITSGSFAALVTALYEHAGATIDISEFAADPQKSRKTISAFRLVLILICAAVAAGLVGVWLFNGIQTEDHVEVIAHRGAAGKAPENTMASIRQGVQDKADWIEIDVQETADGQVVVIHDSDFMKLSGVDTKVWDGTLEEIQKIDIGSWFDPKFAGERVPTLAAVLEAVRDKSRLLIELKYYGHDEQLEQRVIDIVEQAGMVDQVAVMSLKYDGVEKLLSLRPEWQTGLLLSKSLGSLSGLDVDFFAVNMVMASSGFVRRMHAAGKQVYVWTVNDQVSMSQVMSLGVDGIITDEPELARKVLAERAEMSSLERLLIHAADLLGRPAPEKTYRDNSP